MPALTGAAMMAMVRSSYASQTSTPVLQMQFVCSQAELSSALAVVGRAVPSRPCHPILTSVLIEADLDDPINALCLTGFDLSIGIKTSIRATVNEKGNAAVPLHLLESIVRKLPKDSPISVKAKEEKFQLSTANGSYDIAAQDPCDYPDFPLVDSADSFGINDKIIAHALKSVLYCASTDESKQILQGVCITSGDAFEAAATDGHRLAVFAVTGESAPKGRKMQVVVPGRSLKELTRLIAEQPGETVQLSHAKGQAVFRVGTQVLTTRLLEGTFPAYRTLIPETFKSNVIFARKALISSLERVAVLAEQYNKVAKASFAADRACISADAQDIGKGSEDIAITLQGDNLDIAFNVQYLLEALKAFSSEKILMSCNMATTPFILRPFEAEAEAEQIALVMPVQVRA